MQYIKQNERKIERGPYGLMVIMVVMVERGTYGVMFSVLMSPIKAASKSEYNRKKM